MRKYMYVKGYAAAKINMGLEILEERSDGYHEVDMIMQSVGLFDEISIETNSGKDISVEYTQKTSWDPKEDIIYKCAKKFFDYSKVNNPGIKITLNKKIPIGAGLGGGSSDGAATVFMLNTVFGNAVSKKGLFEICASVGSDIPFCICGGTARAKGRGTDLRYITSNIKYYFVIVNPGIFVCTKDAYKKWRKPEKSNTVDLNNLEKFIVNSDFENICENLFNRFESVINLQEVFELKKELCKLGASASLMSGSGSTVYGVFKNQQTAYACMNIMKRKYEKVFLCTSVDYGVKIKNYS